jgi:ABC-2 type transport system permease protein
VVGVLVRLRLTLLRNQARTGIQPLLLVVLGTLLALGVGMVAVFALVGLRLVPLDLAGAAVVVFGALAVVTWVVLPVLTSSDDVMSDPARFALLPLPTRSLAGGLLVASAVAPFAVVTLLAPLATAATFSRGPLPVVAAVVGVVGGLLGGLTCLLASRAVLTAAASTLAGRRGREVSIVIGVFVLSLLGLAGPALAEVGERLQTGAVDAAVQVLAWSPLGAAWAMPWAAAEGRWLVVLGRGAMAAVTVALLWLGYVRAVRARLRPLGGGRSRARSSEVTARASPGRSLLPDTPLGALLQRSLRYWVRDSRYVVSVLSLPVVVGLLLLLPLLTNGPRGFALVTGPLLALLLAFTMLNELAFDGSAVWTSVAAGVRGRDDRAARVLAVLVWATPFTVVAAVLGTIVGGREDLAPAAVGVSIGTLLVGNGVAAVTSVVLPFPVPPTGSSPFAGNPGSAGAAMVQQGLGSLTMFPLLLPLGALAVWAWFVPVVGWALVVVGTAYGTALLAVGVHLGGRQFDRRAPELVGRLSR